MVEGEKSPLRRARERLGSLLGRDAEDEASGAAPVEGAAESRSEAETGAASSAPAGAVRSDRSEEASSEPPSSAGTAGSGQGAELFAVADLLEDQLDVRRALADSGSRPQARLQLLDRLFASQLSGATMDVLRQVVAERWRSSLAMVIAIEERGAQALMSDSGSKLDDVEDELFRFGRTIERESRLSLALSDPGLPLERKGALIDRLLGDRVQPTTLQLVRRVVHHPRGRGVPRALENLARLAADRRQRSIAEVTVARPLEGDQAERLRQAVSEAFDRQVELQVFVDPELLGGVVVRVGDEVVDGSIIRRLADARRRVVR